MKNDREIGLMSDENFERQLANEEAERQKRAAEEKAAAAKKGGGDEDYELAPDYDEQKAKKSTPQISGSVVTRFNKNIATPAETRGVTLELSAVLDGDGKNIIAYEISSEKTKLSRRNILPFMGLTSGEAVDESKISVLNDGKTLLVEAKLMEEAAIRKLAAREPGGRG